MCVAVRGEGEREGGGDADTFEVCVGGGGSVEFCFGDLLGVRSA